MNIEYIPRLIFAIEIFITTEINLKRCVLVEHKTLRLRDKCELRIYDVLKVNDPRGRSRGHST
jgi:hypothetical protein